MATPSSYLLPLADDLTDALTTGWRWILDTTRTITWSISDGFNGEYWLNPTYMIGQIDLMLEGIEAFIDVDFQYVGYFDNPETAYWNGSDINYSFDSGYFMNSPNYWAIGFFPSTTMEVDYLGQPGDVFLNLNSDANDLDYEIGGAGYALLLHETGHALGLKHPHDGGGTGSPTFDDYDLEGLDIEYISVMSYEETYGWDQFSYEPYSPMLFDVIGLQYLYGKNSTYESRDTYWTVWDDGNYGTVYDTGGWDTIEATGGGGWYINIENGGYMKAATGETLIWLLGDFEEVIGSDESDTFVGDDHDNWFTGGDGDDFIDGGGGDDAAIYLHSKDKYQVYAMDEYIFVDGEEAGDLLTNIEWLIFDDQYYAVSSLLAPYVRSSDAYNWDNDIDTGDGFNYIRAEDAQLYRAYMGAMNRMPDAGGFNWWANEIEHGRHDLFSMADGFVNSQEFKGYADTNFDGIVQNFEFVRHMYDGVFGREPDPGGYNYWMGELGSGVSQGEVLVYMTQSNEYIDITLDTVADYLFI